MSFAACRESRLSGKEVSRDTIAPLKRLDLVGAGPRMPAIGASLTYVTTNAFLSLFGLASLRDLPDKRRSNGQGFWSAVGPLNPQPDDLASSDAALG